VKIKSYLKTYDLLNVVMEEQSLRAIPENSIIVQNQILSKEISDKTRSLRVFFMHKTIRRKRKKKRRKRNALQSVQFQRCSKQSSSTNNISKN